VIPTQLIKRERKAEHVPSSRPEGHKHKAMDGARVQCRVRVPACQVVDVDVDVDVAAARRRGVFGQAGTGGDPVLCLPKELSCSCIPSPTLE
jgi:hypothetical protein